MAPHFKQIIKVQETEGKKRRRISPVDYGDEPEKRDNWTTAPSVSVEIDGPEDWPRDTCEPRHDLRPPAAKLSKGPYIDPTLWCVDDRRPVTVKPISKAAIDLLGKYHRRRAFWQAISHGAPVEFAGKELLRVGKTEAYKTLKEMPHGPHFWFKEQFVKCLGNRTIDEGRVVERGPIADNFYVELAGGLLYWDSLVSTLGGQHKIIVKDALADKKDPAAREVMSYAMCSRAFQKWKED
jgi:hypothetical protein